MKNNPKAINWIRNPLSSHTWSIRCHTLQQLSSNGLDPIADANLFIHKRTNKEIAQVMHWKGKKGKQIRI